MLAFALPIINILAWYLTNGMNGISMQSLAAASRQYQASYEEQLEAGGVMGGAAATTPDNKYVTMLMTTTITFTVTTLQLLVGSLVGMILLSLAAMCRKSFSVQKLCTLLQISRIFLEWDMMLILGSLHGLGSVFTNFGFMYGSAALVQIIKLLEPFETLLLSFLLLGDQGKSYCRVGILASMTVVVLGAISLVHSRKSAPPIASILHALLSGMTLSTRNVLQRRQLSRDEQPPKTTISEGSGDNNLSKSSQELSKVEQSIVQFTQLSLRGGLFLGMCTIFIALPNSITRSATKTLLEEQFGVLNFLGESLNWRLMTWHPLYNIFSMITLGFVPALTHSLLNAGKRVFAILLAILWFQEHFSFTTALGLFIVGIGGMWYTWESKQKKEKQKDTIKILGAVGLLSLLYSAQLVEQIGSSSK